MTPFAVHQSADGSLSVVGEIDASTAEQFASACNDLGPDVRIRCDQCTFIDSAGLAVLLAVRSRVVRDGGSVTLIEPSAPIRRLLEVTGLLDAFVVAAD